MQMQITGSGLRQRGVRESLICVHFVADHTSTQRSDVLAQGPFSRERMRHWVCWRLGFYSSVPCPRLHYLAAQTIQPCLHRAPTSFGRPNRVPGGGYRGPSLRGRSVQQSQELFL